MYGHLPHAYVLTVDRNWQHLHLVAHLTIRTWKSSWRTPRARSQNIFARFYDLYQTVCVFVCVWMC